MESTFRGSRGLLARLLHLTAPALLGLTSAAPNAVSSPFERFAPVTEAMIEQPDPADWLMWRRTQNGWGFSPLDRIDTTNVGQLALVWTRPRLISRQQ